MKTVTVSYRVEQIRERECVLSRAPSRDRDKTMLIPQSVNWRQQTLNAPAAALNST
jgi:hypothetical protein